MAVMRKGEFQGIGENLAAGRIVKRLRESLGLTQGQFAQYVHVRFGIEPPTQPSISEWENGGATVPAALLIHAAERLGAQVLLEEDIARRASVNKSYVAVAA